MHWAKKRMYFVFEFELVLNSRFQVKILSEIFLINVAKNEMKKNIR